MKHRAVFSTILFFMKSQTLKKFILCALLAACPFLIRAEEWQTLRDCRLIPNEWNDGDSFHVIHHGQEYIFRLYFVDTPESEDSLRERVAEQAKHFGITPTQSVQAGISAKKATTRFLAPPLHGHNKVPGRSRAQSFDKILRDYFSIGFTDRFSLIARRVRHGAFFRDSCEK